MKNIFLFLSVLYIGIFSHSVAYAQDNFKNVMGGVIDAYPAVASARNQLNSAKSDIDSARWNYFPTPSVAYERADKKVPGVLNESTKYLRLQQPLWTAGRLTAQHEKAEAQFQVAEAFFQEQRTTTAFRWLQIWAEYQSATEKIKAYEVSEAKHADYVRQIERRAQEGYSAVSEVQLSLSRLNAVRAELRQFTSAQVQAVNRLEQMLRKPLGTEPGLKSSIDWPRNHSLITHWKHELNDAQLQEAVAGYPTLKKASANILIGQADVVLTQSRNFPEVYLRSELRKGDVTGSDRAVYVGLNSSFGAGLSNQSAIAAAESKVDAYRSELESKNMEVSEIIQNDLQSFRTQADRLGQLEKTSEANRRYLESSERQYLAGRRSWQEIMNIAREEAQILAQLGDAKAQVWLAHQRLQILTQGLDGYLGKASAQLTQPIQN